MGACLLPCPAYLASVRRSCKCHKTLPGTLQYNQPIALGLLMSLAGNLHITWTKFTPPRQSQLLLAGYCTLPWKLKDQYWRTYPFGPLGHYHPNPRQTRRVNAHCWMRECLRTRMARNEPVLQNFKTGLPTD